LLNNVKQKPLITNNYIRHLKNFSKEDFAADLYEQLVESPENQSDSQFENFINTFHSVLNKHAPMRKKSKKEQKLSEKPWLTKGILKSNKTKNKLYTSSLKENTNDVQLHKKFRNKLAHAVM